MLFLLCLYVSLPPIELQTPSFPPVFVEQLVSTVTEKIHTSEFYLINIKTDFAFLL